MLSINIWRKYVSKAFGAFARSHAITDLLDGRYNHGRSIHLSQALA